MNENFERAFNLLVKIEGGLVDDPHDTGGLTKFGISQKAFPELDIANLSKEDAKKIYKKHYWEICRCDELPSSFDIVVFDTAVNLGTTAAITLLQKALKQKVDGILGLKTLEACRKAGEDELRRFFLYRLFSYSQMINYSRYKNGWFNRLLTVSEVV